jgi:integrase/recombinase XerD
MTPLRRRMLEELQLRNLSQSTIETYLTLIERFARYFKKSPQQLGAEEVRGYLLHLIQGKKASSTVIQTRSALRFLYVCTLKQKWFDDEIPHPKKRVTLPGVISVDEIVRMLDSTQNLKHWTILATFYGTAVRCKELQHLKVSDIDSQRMVLHVREGKGGTPRDIALSSALLERLRLYFRRCRPQDWLFPSGQARTCARFRSCSDIPTFEPQPGICTSRASDCRRFAALSMRSLSSPSIRPEITNRSHERTSAGSGRCLSPARTGVLCSLGLYALRSPTQSLSRHLRLSHRCSRCALRTV